MNFIFINDRKEILTFEIVKSVFYNEYFKHFIL